jgi:hypothetical protein
MPNNLILKGLSERTLPIKANAYLFGGGSSRTARTGKSNFRAFVSEIKALRSSVVIIVKEERVKKGVERRKKENEKGKHNQLKTNAPFVSA